MLLWNHFVRSLTSPQVQNSLHVTVLNFFSDFKLYFEVMCVSTDLCFSPDKDLNLPPLSASHFSCFSTDSECDIDELERRFFKESILPFAATPLEDVPVSSATVLCDGVDVKTTLEVILDISDLNLKYLPGDTIGILPKNDEKEVNFIMNILGLKGDDKYKIVVDQTKKKKLPPHIPPIFSAKFLLQSCLDLRAVVKKTLLRALAEHTSEPADKRRIMELCSREGSGEYNEYILMPKTSIIDILQAFSSCRPPLSLLIEHIPRLQPRPYSIASSPLQDPNSLRLVFNVVHDARNRRGVCSGWLFDLTRPLHDLSFKLSDLELSDNLKPMTIKIPIYLRNPTKFRIPENSTMPLIMIGPGTGIAPFLGFLEHRQQEQHSHRKKESENQIMFGCRHRDRDDIYRKKFLMMEKENLCIYHVSYSRDSGTDHPKYVQDLMRLNQKDLVDQLLTSESIVFICGNGLTMTKDIAETLAHLIASVKGVTEKEANEVMKVLEKKGQIVVELWS